jgi:hypothetical protein
MCKYPRGTGRFPLPHHKKRTWGNGIHFARPIFICLLHAGNLSLPPSSSWLSKASFHKASKPYQRRNITSFLRLGAYIGWNDIWRAWMDSWEDPCSPATCAQWSKRLPITCQRRSWEGRETERDRNTVSDNVMGRSTLICRSKRNKAHYQWLWTRRSPFANGHMGVNNHGVWWYGPSGDTVSCVQTQYFKSTVSKNRGELEFTKYFDHGIWFVCCQNVFVCIKTSLNHS